MITCTFIFASQLALKSRPIPQIFRDLLRPSFLVVIPRAGPSFTAMKSLNPPELALRHLPDLSEASFQIPQADNTDNDLLLADGSDDFFRGADDTLTTPPSRILSGLTFHPCAPYEESKPPELPNSPTI